MKITPQNIKGNYWIRNSNDPEKPYRLDQCFSDGARLEFKQIGNFASWWEASDHAGQLIEEALTALV